MCGFVGAVWRKNENRVSQNLFEHCTDLLSHRGPDDRGFYFSEHTSKQTPACWLGHRRLSIIDLSTGQQPLANETQTLHLVCNGEIYNYRELTTDLKKRGHQFATESDSEVILHLYEEYGTDCVQHLLGMFSFAIWNSQNDTLFIARDRIGQKPLFYSHQSDRFLFASELKAFLPLSTDPLKVNPQAIDHFLRYQYVPHTQPILSGIEQLPPAHTGLWQNGELTISRYWQAPYNAPLENTSQSHNETKEKLRELLTDAVRLRLRSDVPVGTFLSGGIDSTIITGLVSQETSTPVDSFSIGFPAKEFDESTYAQLAARHFQTNHHQQEVTPAIVNLLPKLAWHFDQPFADSSAIPTYLLSQLTKEKVSVVLTGDGADELFSGYDRYRASAMAAQLDQLPRPLKKFLAANLWQKIPGSIQYRSWPRRLKRFLSEMNNSPIERYFRWISIHRQSDLDLLFTNDFKEQLDETVPAINFLADALQHASSRDLVTQITCSDLNTYLPGDILTKVDIASMAHGLECRSPFLDHRVVELAAKIPQNWKLDRKQGKKLLKETFHNLIPQKISNRSKMGFGVPLDHWFRNELKELLPDILLSETCIQRGYFRRAGIQQLIDEHVSHQQDHSARLWALLTLELWHRTYLDQPQNALAPITL